MQTVIGVFDDSSSAQQAMERVTGLGIPRDQVHLEAGQGGTAASTAGTSSGGRPQEPQGVLGSIGGFFANLFESHTEQAGTYSEAVRRGSNVVVVDTQSEQQADEVADVLRACGAIDIDERTQQWRSAGWDGFDPAAQPAGTGQPIGTHSLMGTGASVGIAGGMAGLAGASLGRTDDVDDRATLGASQDTAVGGLSGRERTAGTAATATDSGQILDVVEEQLQVGKRLMDRGGVRIIQRVSERPVRELVTLREEHAVVERRAVDRPASPADLGNATDSVIEVRETVEEPVVAKTAHVVEEVVVGKQVQEREEAITDTVRRKDVEVERVEGQTGERLRERAVAASDNDRGTTTDLLGRDKQTRDKR